MAKIKIKTHSGSKKRFSKTKSGLIKHASANRSHILNKKSTKRKRRLRKGSLVDVTNVKAVELLIPYK